MKEDTIHSGSSKKRSSRSSVKEDVKISTPALGGNELGH
jgi:hypothetical protein